MGQRTMCPGRIDHELPGATLLTQIGCAKIQVPIPNRDFTNGKPPCCMTYCSPGNLIASIRLGCCPCQISSCLAWMIRRCWRVYVLPLPTSRQIAGSCKWRPLRWLRCPTTRGCVVPACGRKILIGTCFSPEFGLFAQPLIAKQYPPNHALHPRYRPCFSVAARASTGCRPSGAY